MAVLRKRPTPAWHASQVYWWPCATDHSPHCREVAKCDAQKNLRKLQSLMTLRNTGDMIFKAFLSNAAERRRQQRGHALENGSAQPKGVGLVLRKPKWLRVRCN